MAASRSIGGVFATLTLRDLKFRNSLNRAGKSLAKFGTMAVKMGAVASAAIGAYLVKSVSMASDMQETLGKSEVIFGKNSKAMETWSKTAADSFGQSAEEALAAAADIGNMFKAMGLGEKEVANMSKSMVELGGDLASFNNTSPEDAINALSSALRGEAEPIRKYGVLLDAATLKAKALAMGLHKGKGALAPATRAMAAYQVILDQTETAQGDFAKTSNGLANSQRIISARIKDMTAEIGQGLLPTVLNLTTALKGVDFTTLGGTIGETISAGLSLLTSGKAWDIFILDAKRAQILLQTKLPQGNFAAAVINTVWDSGTEPGGEGFDWGKTFAKYRDAGLIANAEVIADLDEQIDKIGMEIALEAAPKIAEGKPTLPENPPIELPPEVVAPLIEAKDPIDIAGAREEASGGGSDDYLRRGLSLGKPSGEQIQKKQEIYLKGILEVLNLAKTDGKLTWA